MPIQRWQPAFEGMSDDEYKIAVKRLAQQELIPNFVDDLLGDIDAAGVDISLVRLSLFANSVSSDGDLEMSLWGGGYANTLTHVVSINMNQPQAVGDELATSIAATFLPTSGGQVYSNEEMLFVAVQSWDWVAARGASADTTYLVGFELQGATSKAKTTGSVPGYLLNPYSLDFHNGYLRVATIQNFWTPIRFFPMDMVSSLSSANATILPEDSTIDDSDASRTLNQIIVLKVPATANTNLTTLKQVGSVQLGKKNEVRPCVTLFFSFTCAPPS
jgi:Beta propeller domain